MAIIPAAQTRRQFALGLAGAALAYPYKGNNIYNPRLAAHTSTWVSEAAALKKRPADLLENALAAIKKAGYRRVELASAFTGVELRDKTLALLNRFGLEPSIIAAEGPIYTTSGAEASRAYAAALALFFAGRAEFLSFSCSPKPGGGAKSDAELDTQSSQLDLLGQEVQREGLRLLLDHGLPEMASDAREWRRTIAHTDPRLVSVCLDLENVLRAGASPWPLIDAAGSRLRSVHIRNTRHGADQEALDFGDIDLAAVARILRQEQYDGYLVVELSRVPNRRESFSDDLAFSRWRMQEVFGSRPGALPVDMGPHVRFRRPR